MYIYILRVASADRRFLYQLPFLELRTPSVAFCPVAYVNRCLFESFSDAKHCLLGESSPLSAALQESRARQPLPFGQSFTPTVAKRLRIGAIPGRTTKHF